jgi:hypothetical protein
MWTYIFGPLLAFLPMRWRARLVAAAPVNWPIAGLLSGFLEGLGGLCTFFWWYFHIMERYLGAIGGAAVEGKTSVPVSDQQIGGTALILWLLHPATWAITYLTFEGALRLLAALVAEESPGSLPLVIVDRLLTYGQRKRELAKVPLAQDEVTRGDGQQEWDLKVASCRAKLFWKYPLAVRYEGEFFTVAGGSYAAGSSGRPHVYLLRRAHTSGALRGLENYHPEDVLRGGADSGFFGVVYRELRRRWHVRRAPLVPDEVRETLSHDAAGLEVRSCRPKPEWREGRLVRYEEGYYRVESSRVATAPRPFIFTLRKLPAGRPTKSVLVYTPDEPLQGVGRT